jgi:hypothetical protein
MNEQHKRIKSCLTLDIISQAIGQEYESARVTKADYSLMLALREKPHKCYIAAYIGLNPIILSFKADKRTAIERGMNAVRQLRQNKFRAFMLEVIPVDPEETAIYKRIFEDVRPKTEWKPGPAPVESHQDQKAANISSGILQRMSTRFYKACVGIASLI